MRHRFFAHLVWTTRQRAPLIDLARAEFLARSLPRIALQERGQVWAMGVVSTHVHLLVRLDPSTAIPRLVQRLKGGTAYLSAKEAIGNPQRPLRWTKGYNLESVSPKSVLAATRYIEGQSSHHPGEAIAGWRPPRTFSVASATDAEQSLQRLTDGEERAS